MINNFIAGGLYKNDFDILEFENSARFNETIDLLEETSHLLSSADTSISEDDILIAFANDFLFESLHKKICTDIERLESEDNLTEDNDPDNHFIVSDYLRAVLSPYGEVVVDDLLYVFREEYVLGVRILIQP